MRLIILGSDYSLVKLTNLFVIEHLNLIFHVRDTFYDLIEHKLNLWMSFIAFYGSIALILLI